MLIRRDDNGKTTVFRSGTEAMDRLVYVWGEKGPAVPLFFSPKGAVGYSLLQSVVLGDSPGLSPAAIDEQAWQKFQGLG